MKKSKQNQGFTLLEILLVVAAIAILAGIVIIAINPTKQLGTTRDAQRAADVNTILNAVYQYAIDNNGDLPSEITTSAKDICQTDAASCTGIVDLSVLTDNEEYLIEIPEDPTDGTTASTGYQIYKTANNRVVVTAPGTEQADAVISASR